MLFFWENAAYVGTKHLCQAGAHKFYSHSRDSPNARTSVGNQILYPHLSGHCHSGDKQVASRVIYKCQESSRDAPLEGIRYHLGERGSGSQARRTWEYRSKGEGWCGQRWMREGMNSKKRRGAKAKWAREPHKLEEFEICPKALEDLPQLQEELEPGAFLHYPVNRQALQPTSQCQSCTLSFHHHVLRWHQPEPPVTIAHGAEVSVPAWQEATFCTGPGDVSHSEWWWNPNMPLTELHADWISMVF